MCPTYNTCGICGYFFGADEDGLGACDLYSEAPAFDEQGACSEFVDESEYLCPKARAIADDEVDNEMEEELLRDELQGKC